MVIAAVIFLHVAGIAGQVILKKRAGWAEKQYYI